jgi:pimeloyl-ACP methyl ester carboxylesterase
MTLQHKTLVLPDGFKVGVTVGGSGTPLVFLHGLSVSALAYGELLELLADSGFYVVGIDLPDHGRSDSLPWGHTVFDMARVVAHTMSHLGVCKAVMAGHSMGGAVVVEFAAHYPWRVDTAILLNAAAGEEHHRAIEVDASPSVPLRAAQLLSGAVLDIVGDARQAGRLRVLSERLDLANRLRASVSGSGVIRSVYALMKSNTTEALRTMKLFDVNTVIVHGDRDRIVPLKAAESAALLSGGRLHVIGKVYHSWMIADPLLALDIIRDAVEIDEAA